MEVLEGAMSTRNFHFSETASGSQRDPSELTGAGYQSDGFFFLKTRFSTEKNKFQRHIFMKIHRYIGHKIQRVTIFLCLPSTVSVF
jgi:hypothetical protein